MDDEEKWYKMSSHTCISPNTLPLHNLLSTRFYSDEASGAQDTFSVADRGKLHLCSDIQKGLSLLWLRIAVSVTHLLRQKGDSCVCGMLSEMIPNLIAALKLDSSISAVAKCSASKSKRHIYSKNNSTMIIFTSLPRHLRPLFFLAVVYS